MGLDMYLNVTESISNYDFEKSRNGNNDRFDAIIEASGLATKVEDRKRIKVEYEAMYWRKANQIHGWFVENCGDGVDECQVIPVRRERLVELHSICGQLLDTGSRELAMELLPPTPGFFFGHYEIDEGYWNDIQHTFDGLTKVLEDIPEDRSWDYDIEYQASW